MSRLTDAFEAMTRRSAPRGADSVLAAARADAARDRSRRRAGALVGVAAATLAIAGIGWAVMRDDGSSTVKTGPANDPTPTTPVTTAEAPELSEVGVFFTPSDHVGSCDEVTRVPRDVTSEGTPALAGAIEALLAGPTSAESERQLTSWFSSDTADMLQGVELSAGTATIDLSSELPSTIPNASTACGSANLLAQLNTTALQFPEVARAVFTLDGDVDAFYSWLQMVSPNLDMDWGGEGERPEQSGPITFDGYQAFVDANQPDWSYYPRQAAVALIGPWIEGAEPPATIDEQPGEGDQFVVTITQELTNVEAAQVYRLVFDPPTSGPLELVEATLTWVCHDPLGTAPDRQC